MGILSTIINLSFANIHKTYGRHLVCPSTIINIDDLSLSRLDKRDIRVIFDFNNGREF